ncbi:lanmodulin-like [Haliotis asinina]|uniref:lanmodulin-like n=1 Tax=Haliotis asinina TaxID=109174 RepID=UPI0035320C37
MRSLFLCSFALVLGVVASQTVDAIAKSVFDSLDANKDGTLVLGELEGYFNTGDVDGDGTITKSDFLALLQGNNQAAAQFAKYDANKDGVLTLDDVKLIYNEFDTDGDSKVSLKDFQAKYAMVLMVPPSIPIGVGK